MKGHIVREGFPRVLSIDDRIHYFDKFIFGPDDLMIKFHRFLNVILQAGMDDFLFCIAARHHIYYCIE